MAFGDVILATFPRARKEETKVKGVNGVNVVDGEEGRVLSHRHEIELLDL